MRNSILKCLLPVTGGEEAGWELQTALITTLPIKQRQYFY
jgi:hypothetical protein